jgi:hypothetical protein
VTVGYQSPSPGVIEATVFDSFGGQPKESGKANLLARTSVHFLISVSPRASGLGPCIKHPLPSSFARASVSPSSSILLFISLSFVIPQSLNIMPARVIVVGAGRKFHYTSIAP